MTNKNKATTEINLEGDKVLTISTRKLRTGWIISSASVATREGAFLKHLLYTDFNRVISQDPCSRITQKAIDNLHAKSLDRLEDIKNLVNIHYGKNLC